ncbi:MAG: sirohydrochlorin cobaltochelatase [Firmicutes bacterium]|uniref:Sirohydrochlorin cobaltochelatase n=1 Tax=Candidatus Scybalomonas excrementavium TaxID=2840943 RepID=A0A9D9HYN7_9FIRM|nr:sirohydrochlorin cobaltochelatase [Candidatus Scybalomonas excrementavium]
MKKALVIISYGTTCEVGMKGIIHMEESLKKMFSEYDCFRAFTSEKVIRKLRLQQGIQVSSPDELLQQLKKYGYEEIICQPTHIICGKEFHKMMEQLKDWKEQFSSFFVGQPLLSDESDYRQCVNFYKKEILLGEKEALIVIGHGSESYANQAYGKLETMFRTEGSHQVYMGTINGTFTVEQVISKLKEKEYQILHLVPFMIVSGRHVKRDIIEKETSWKKQLEKEGYEVRVYQKGLSEHDEIVRIFAQHIKNK